MAPTIPTWTSQVNSPATLAAVLLGAVTFLWFINKIHTAVTSPLHKIPGPFWSHFTHYPLKLAVVTGRRTQFIHALHERYGPLVRISPGELSCSDAEASKQIHRPGSGFVKAAWYKKFVSGYAAGIFDMSDPREHAARRRLFARAFSKTEIRGRWEQMVRDKAELAVARIGEELARDGEADAMKWWTFMATDVSAHLMFGESFRMLEYGKKNEYYHVLESTTKGSGIGAELPLVPKIGRLIPLPALQHMFNANAKLLGYGTKAVEASKAQGSGQGASIFAQLDPDEHKSSPFPLAEIDIRTEAGNFILAGSDTTAVTLTYLTWAVLAHPDVQRELEAEVARLSDDFTDADVEQNCPLVNAVINETLRLYGAAPGSLPRTVPKGGAQLVGHFVPEGYTVSTQAWSVHRDQKLWPDAERFRPHRWLALPPNTAPSSLAFSPFGAGTRICLGLHLAYMELRLATALFFRHRRGARLADRTTADTMEVINFFLIRPKADRCFVRL